MSIFPNKARTAAAGLALCMAALWIGAGCQEGQKGYQAPPPPKVTVAKPQQRAVTVYSQHTGVTKAFSSVEIRARVSGLLKEVKFAPSAKVKQGQLLFVIDPKPYQANLDKALADLATARANLQLAQATLVRKERAYKQRAVSEVDVIQARAEKAKAAAGIASAQAAVQSARIDLGYTTIHAPHEGWVSRSLVDVGNLVGSGQNTLLTTVVDDDPMYAYFSVPEADVLQYLEDQGGREADSGTPKGQGEYPRVLMGPGNTDEYPYQGRIDYIDNQVDSSTGTIGVRGVFGNAAGKLVPGVFVRVKVPIKRLEKALLVPDAALGADQGGSYLLVVNQKDEVEHRKVKVGSKEGALRVILEGIKPEDRVVVAGVQRARPGAKVTPVEAGQEEKAAKPQGGEAPKKSVPASQ